MCMYVFECLCVCVCVCVFVCLCRVSNRVSPLYPDVPKKRKTHHNQKKRSESYRMQSNAIEWNLMRTVTDMLTVLSLSLSSSLYCFNVTF